MWAVQYHRYGDPSVLETEDVAVRKPKPGEVMVETVSSGVSAIDLMYRSGKLRMHGVGFPKQTGFDVLGIVRESRVPGLEADRWVWAVLDVEPLRRRGTAVQYLTVGSERIGAFPEGFVPPTEAGSLPLGSLTALRGIRDGVRVHYGERLLIVGAGGAVGLAAIQLAVALGVETDAVCGARAIELCRGLGATRVFDHATPEALEPRRSGDYDAVLIAAGNGRDWLGAARRPGRIVLTRGDAWLRTLPAALRARRRIGAIAAGHKAAELTELAQLVAAGILRPVVDRTYAVTDLARAHEEFGKGGTAGSRLVLHTMP